MKKVYLYCLIIIGMISCGEKKPETELPSWVETKIEESNVDGFCRYWSVTRYNWQGDSYIDFYSPISSCYVCEVYYENGTKVEWESLEDINQFREERTNATVLWDCDI